jgi:hypothetical protein
MEISWRNASYSAQPLKNKTLMLRQRVAGGYRPLPGTAAAGILTEARWDAELESVGSFGSCSPVIRGVADYVGNQTYGRRH